MPALTWPAGRAFAVTPDDNTDLTTQTRGIYVGTSGNLKITTVGGDTVTLNSLAAGVVHAIRVKRVHSTDTTAANIIGLY
jgi:hypothetical protein